MSDRSDITGSLRILHIGKYFPPHPGGMETYLRDLMNVQKRQGLEVMALVHASERGLFDMEESVDALDGTTYQVMRSARWFNLSFVPISPGFIWSAFKAIKHFKPDVIHIHHPNSSATYLLLLGAAKKVAWVSHWHSDINMERDGWLKKVAYCLYRRIEENLLSKSAKILVTTTEYMKHSSALQIHMYKSTAVPLGLDRRRIPNPSQVAPLPRPTGPLALFLGRLASYKGLPHLIAAIDMTPGFNCWIAGSGEMHRQLKKDIHKRKLNARVKLLDEISEEEKWSLLTTADVLVLPSNQRTEAFGLVMLEAAFFGTPVIATSISGSGTSWVAAQLPSSKTIPSDDVKALSKALKDSLTLKAVQRTDEKLVPGVLDLNSQATEITQIYRQILRR